MGKVTVTLALVFPLGFFFGSGLTFDGCRIPLSCLYRNSILNCGDSNFLK